MLQLSSNKKKPYGIKSGYVLKCEDRVVNLCRFLKKYNYKNKYSIQNHSNNNNNYIYNIDIDM